MSGTGIVNTGERYSNAFSGYLYLDHTTCASDFPDVWVDQLSWKDAVSDPVLSSPQSKGGLVVAYHTASWCGPCKAVWPHVVEMAAANPEVSFLKIDGLRPPKP
jgi:thiol-disulfide isomerase/thioredoxin